MSVGFTHAVDEYRRAIVAARALWREGLLAECHAYVACALRAMLRAWVPIDASLKPASQEPAPDEQQGLAALARAAYPDMDRLQAALAATADVTVPTGRIPSGTALPPDFEWIWTEAERLSRFTIRRLTPPKTRQQIRLRLGAAVAVALVVALVVMVRQWGRPSVSASGIYGPEYPADYAVDGIETTEWLLPDSTPGWLEIAFPSPRRVRGVHLLNAHNRYYMDRGAESVRVTAFSDKTPVAVVDGHFARLMAQRSPLDLALDAQRVTRLRVDVLSYFKSGGALAEIKVR